MQKSHKLYFYPNLCKITNDETFSTIKLWKLHPLRPAYCSELETYTFRTTICGYHVLKTTYEWNIGEKLAVGNVQHDRCAVSILKLSNNHVLCLEP